MKAVVAFALLVALVSGEFQACEQQARFDIVMCKSHMCTDCALSTCTKQCQEWQMAFAGCRCKEWPEARKSFTGGDFKGKGKSGDAGDYAM
mmetsp:Transcript_2409/g.7163  ORF Transcript_2409/g.7163 Transcript_2409/m.7163 type:complete len:91 (-) Transcript_2409:31-303(-)